MELDSFLNVLERLLVGLPLGVTTLQGGAKGEIAVCVFLNDNRKRVLAGQFALQTARGRFT
jgi:hypothetical protein